MLTIKQNDFLEATGLKSRSVTLKFNGLPSTQDGRFKAYALADVLPLLGKKHAGAAVALLERARDSGVTYVGGDEVLGSSARLEEWVRQNVPGAALRLHQVRTSFFDGLARGVRTNGLTSDVERLRLLVIRTPGALRYILAGDPVGLPCDWATWARHFALLHSARSNLTAELVQGEAA
ncbi:hypothetical protein EOW65_03640 [Sinirhodobacter ferrireducens]|uniref:Uncharacterized protein n=1 Tax=Paenirhodobacter ferrireducens TaxID=1215032 RepID=A0A443LRZ3_9RHOB|nr:hypothetical protein [Sinirhodobacter ferrireducens]RWR51954.1 hypothetical protein EOW65_03640 [Sinirhodobacter ferrireducens]